MATACEPLPPNETGIELTGSVAFDQLHHAFQEMVGVARATLQVTDIAVVRRGRWVTVRVQFHGDQYNEVTIRIPKARAQEIHREFGKALRVNHIDAKDFQRTL